MELDVEVQVEEVVVIILLDGVEGSSHCLIQGEPYQHQQWQVSGNQVTAGLDDEVNRKI